MICWEGEIVVWYQYVKIWGRSRKKENKAKEHKKKKANPGILSPDGQINLLDVKCNWRKSKEEKK